MKTTTVMSSGTTPAQGGCVSAPATRKERPRGFFSSWKLLGSVFIMLFTMVSNNASAVAITGAALTTTAGSTTNTTTCVNGYYASGWFGGSAKVWTWQVSTTGYQNIKFLTPTSSSATGPHNAVFEWRVGTSGSWTSLTTLGWSGTGCTSSGLQSLSPGADNQAVIQVRAIMTGATASGGTSRMSIEAFSGDLLPTPCSGTPTAGTISAGATEFCGSGSTTLSLTGATSGTGISYQWQSSPAGMGTWSNVGTNSTSYNTGTITSSTDYQVIVTCSTGPNSSTTATTAITVHTLPTVGTLSLSGSNPFLVNDLITVTPTVPGGSFSSSNTGVLNIGSTTGAGTATFGGTAVITYTVLDGTTLCTNSTTTNVDVVWPNTLALYAGYGGTSTGVIPGDADVVPGTLTAVGFGTNSACGTGGLSGLTVPTSVTGFANGNPHVYYQVNATTGNALNVFQIAAKARRSATGPQKAVLAYSFDGANWFPDAEMNLVDGSCGSNANSWFWLNGGPTITGITGNFFVGIFPYGSSSNSGVFQLNSLEIYGEVSTDANCNGGTLDAGTLVSLSNTNICASGSRTLNLIHGGGVGVSYQWESSADGMSYAPTSAADTNTFFNTGTLTATTWYQVVVTCEFGGSVTSAPLQITVVPDEPHDLVSGPTVYNVGGNEDFETNVFTNQGSAPDSILYVSSYVSTADVDPATGIVNPFVFPANDVRITRVKFTGGCSTATTDTIDIVHPCAIAYYLGENGTSTGVTDVQNVTSTSLASTGFGTGTPCSSGGKSGLNNAPSSFGTSGAHVSFKTAVNGSDIMIVNGIHATVRRSGSGPVSVRFAYRVHATGSSWGNWIDEGQDQQILQDDCGYSSEEITWGGLDPVVPSFAYLNATDYDSMEVALFPYDAANAGGTFQVNSFTICGVVKASCETASVDLLDLNEEVVNGQTYPAGANAFFIDGFVNAYWGITGDANNPVYGYFDYNDITVGDIEGNLNIVSCYPSATIFAVGDFGSCFSVGEGVLNFDCEPKSTGTVTAAGKQSSVKFYPNPATNVVNVTANEKVNVSVFSVDGKLMLEQKDAKSINVEALTSGVYFIKAFDNQNHTLKIEKMIKQ